MPGLSLKQTLDLALQLHQSGRFTEAETHYRTVLAAMPNHADALHLLGLALHQSGRNELALGPIRKALSIRPSTAEYHNSLTAVYMGLDQPKQAIEAGQRATQLQPQLPEAWFNLGNALGVDKQNEAAIDAYRKAIALRPIYPQAYLGYGNALLELKRFDEAVAAYRQSIAQKPTMPDAHYNLGNALRALEDNEQAVACYREAIALKTDHLEAINNLSCTLQQMGKLEEALDHLIKAREAHPTKARVHSNLGNVLAEDNQWQAAIECYQQALVVQPDYHDAKFNRAIALLMLQDFDRGWKEYESRWLCKTFPSPPRYTDKPLWHGEPLEGRRILLHAEQGLGDTLQFARFIPLVAARGGKVIFQVQTSLHRLLQNTPGAAKVIARDLQPIEFDVQCPLWSLPLMLGTTPQTIPPNPPSVFFDAEQSQRWRERLDALPPHRLSVGLIWSGSPQFTHNYRRSTRLAKLAPLAEVDGITFISLQKGPASSQATAPPAGMQLIDWTSELDDFADTAALINQLDLVITTDTGAAHLSALMGKPTWILLMHSPDFRWLLQREDSPWYPSVRLLRQPMHGDWETPIHRIAQELKSFSPVQD